LECDKSSELLFDTSHNAEFSGIEDGRDEDFVLDEDVDGSLFPTIGPAVEDLAEVSTLRADFALATMPLLKDDLA